MKLWPYLLSGLIAGVIGLAIPWGNPDGFHGTGIPFASVYWDKPHGTMIDYPNPLAFILNPALGGIVGFCVWLVIKFARKARNGNIEASRR